MPDGPRIGYRPRPDATPEDETRVLADVYAFLIERAEREKAARAERDAEDEKPCNSSDPCRAGGDETEGNRTGRHAGDDQRVTGLEHPEPDPPTRAGKEKFS